MQLQYDHELLLVLSGCERDNLVDSNKHRSLRWLHVTPHVFVETPVEELSQSAFEDPVAVLKRLTGHVHVGVTLTIICCHKQQSALSRLEHLSPVLSHG